MSFAFYSLTILFFPQCQNVQTTLPVLSLSVRSLSLVGSESSPEWPDMLLESRIFIAWQLNYYRQPILIHKRGKVQTATDHQVFREDLYVGPSLHSGLVLV